MTRATKVLLIDDQPIVYESIRQMLSDSPEIILRYCQNPLEALKTATEFQPTVILQDLVMPEVDGLTLVTEFRNNEETKKIPLIVLSVKEDPTLKAEAFSLGANDYLVKIPDEVELRARVCYHSKSYLRLLERDEAYQLLKKSEEKLQGELEKAAAYVKELLPKPIQTQNLTIDWRFTPSALLGGDAFGYEWLDEHRLSIYLLDVCGHGVGAALFSISLLNTLSGQKLSHCNFEEPQSVLTALNSAFPMEEHNDMFFTIWYGVLDTKEKKITYSSAGHPAPLLISEGVESLLKTKGVASGVSREATYSQSEVSLKATNRLYLFSDGVFEVFKEDGSTGSYSELLDVIKDSQGKGSLEQIQKKMQKLNNNRPFEDDYSMVELVFNP